MKDHESAFPVMDATRAYENGAPCADYACSDPGMTKYEYAAIHLKVPRSGDPGIDAMIRESRRAEFAGQIMAGMLAWEKTKVDPEGESEVAFAFADAMLAEWKGR
jgi:hypothetical protein